VTARVYRRMREEAAAVLAAGLCVIADALHARPAEREAVADVARAAGVPFVGLWLEAPAAVLTARIAARRDDASDATVDVLKRQLAYDLGPMSWTRVDAGGALEDVIAAARRAAA
jgi:predicted kinase